MLGKLYKVYKDMQSQDATWLDTELHPVTSILKSIEKRWAKTDQDLFIACLFLNPLIGPGIFNAEASRPN